MVSVNRTLLCFSSNSCVADTLLPKDGTQLARNCRLKIEIKGNLTLDGELVAGTRDVQVDTTPPLGVVASAEIWYALFASFVHVHVTCCVIRSTISHRNHSMLSLALASFQPDPATSFVCRVCFCMFIFLSFSYSFSLIFFLFIQRLEIEQQGVDAD